MHIEMFNGWYFLFFFLQIGAIVGLYFALRKAPPFVQNLVLFSLLALGLIFHFAKLLIPPYSVFCEVTGERLLTSGGLRDSWFINICAVNIALFPFLFFSKNKYVKDYMFYMGVLTGIIVLIYPQEPIGKGDAAKQMAEIWDILRFYYHHWMIIAVPLLMVLLKKHKPSYKRVWVAPVGLLIVMLIIILNQVFQSELGFVALRDGDFFDVSYKNASYIWKADDDISRILSSLCPKFFKEVAVPITQHCESCGTSHVIGYETGEKLWPWFWMIFPVFILITPLSFGIAMVFDAKAFGKDVAWTFKHIKQGGIKEDFKRLGTKIKAMVTAKNTDYTPKKKKAPTLDEDSPTKN